jgi:membrane associated rhomboid family serine protease/outer membrane protein assembly factor BamD (BamD/ComL family)
VVGLVLAHFAAYGIVALILLVRGPDPAVVWYASLSLVPGSIQPHTLLTYALLHENVFHLSANMLFLWVFGGSVEDAIGWRRFLILYVAAVAIGGALEAFMAGLLARSGSVTPIVGASGAISAIIGVFAFRFYRSSVGFVGLPFRIPALLLLLTVMAGEMGLAVLHFVRRDQMFAVNAAAHWAHVGGFLFGILWARFMRVSGSGRIEYLEHDAQRAAERGAYPAAAHRWEEVIKHQPGNVAAEAELAYALSQMGEQDRARELYENSIRELLKRGKRHEAASHYVRTVELAESIRLTSQELLQLSGALEEQGELPRAIEALTRVMSEHPNSPESGIAALRSAAMHLKAGDHESARSLAVEYLERNPNSELRSFAEDLRRRAEAPADSNSSGLVRIPQKKL